MPSPDAYPRGIYQNRGIEMLTEIRMNAVASFKHSTSLITDKRINLIYGLNGTGKSTISNFLYNPSDARFIQCEVVPERCDPILVYNQTFIQDNFFVSDSLKGIFSLSKENKVAEQKITAATATLRKLEDQLQIKQAEEQHARYALESQKQQAADETWKIKTTHSGGDRILEFCLEGLKGQKDKLFGHLLSVSKPKGEPPKNIQALRDEAQGLRGESAQSLPSLSPVTFGAQDVESADLFGASITGNANSEIAALIEKLGNSHWVKQGLQYLPGHVDANGHPCPFCQENTITLKLVDSVKNYFDGGYQEKMDTLAKCRSRYATALAALSDISNYTDHKFAANRGPALSKKYKTLFNIISSNLSKIDEKIRNPKLPQGLANSSIAIKSFNDEVYSVNADIQSYNDRLKDREAALRALKDAFWSVMRWQYDQTVSRFEKDRQIGERQITALHQEIREMETEIAKVRNEIAAAQKETVNVDEAIDAINAGLLDLGIEDFKVRKYSENRYRIVRVGESEDAFHTLSEGERMMISFLYFCELCKGRLSAEDTQIQRIAVIDDPISSLSHVFVFNVGQLIRSVFFRSNRFSQVFVLTHSLYFFYELTDTNHERRKDSQKLFRISKRSAGSDIQEMRYEEIQNDYQAYWSVVNDPTQPPALIANCMRNIVEYFFNFVNKRDLNNVFMLPALQDVKFQAFCRYVNRESHSLGQNIFDMKEFNYDAFKAGLKFVFEKTGYQEHFATMSKV
jgi:wobble nucleotide-excising tRNase